MSIDISKGRRLIAEAEDAREMLRSMGPRVVEARQDAALAAGRIYSKRPDLAGVALAEMALWSPEDLQRLAVSGADLRAAIEASEYASSLARRYAAAAAAAAPAVKLGDRVRTFLLSHGEAA